MKKNNKSEYYTGGETKMISESYIKDLLLSMGYIKKNHIYEKFFPSVDCYIKVDLKNRTIIYPEDYPIPVVSVASAALTYQRHLQIQQILWIQLM